MNTSATEKLPESIQELVNGGKVTYRGCGVLDMAHILIKVNGREYKITGEKFIELGGIKKIKFSAPYRKV